VKSLKSITIDHVQSCLDQFVSKPCFIHLEATQGAYAKKPSGAFIRNAQVQIDRAKITGTNPYRVGLKIPMGWIYAEGLTVCETDRQGRLLLLEGHDSEGKLQVALHLSLDPL
jgi:hypothetical protein